VSNLSIIQIKILKVVNLTLDCGKINVDAFPSSEKQLKTLVKFPTHDGELHFANHNVESFQKHVDEKE
jgi:2-phospho-L-lactate transferase/gluconeogenesis factor (CofD/UPF0052 family)